jgi:hypothetical protein
VRALANACGFQVSLDSTKSHGKKRLWRCSSESNCPFAAGITLSGRGYTVRCHLEHSHIMHHHAKKDLALTTYTTEAVEYMIG